MRPFTLLSAAAALSALFAATLFGVDLGSEIEPAATATPDSLATTAAEPAPAGSAATSTAETPEPADIAMQATTTAPESTAPDPKATASAPEPIASNPAEGATSPATQVVTAQIDPEL